MTRSQNSDPKLQALRQSHTLNPHAKAVRDPLFQEAGFFDPRDLAQVKYEMLRRVQKEDTPVSQAAVAFGFSRPSFYKAQEDFTRQGLGGLIPRKRGPKRRRKLKPEILEFVEQLRLQEPSLKVAHLVQRIQQKFGLTVHRRSLERALLAVKKKPQNRPAQRRSARSNRRV
jgi:transposase